MAGRARPIFPGNGIGKFGISMDETFFFFFFLFLTPLSGNLEIPFLQHGPLSRIMMKFFCSFFFSFFLCDGEIEPSDRLTKYGEQLSTFKKKIEKKIL